MRTRNLTERRERYRAILNGNRCVHPASVFDPISARIAEDLGFEAGMLSGSMATATVLGVPDAAVLTLSEFAEQIRRVCRASSISIMVDADHGYGNALNVMRTVEELEAAGVAALTIEDTQLPQRFGIAKRVLPRRECGLISVEEGVGKMKAALAARQDPSLVIAARTSLGAAGVDETVRRAKAYEKAGVDAMFLSTSGVMTREEVVAVHAAIRIPLLLGKIPDELTDDFLASNGVRIVLQGHLPFEAAVKAVHDVLKALRDGASPTQLVPRLASSELLAQATRRERYNQWIGEFLN